MRNSVPPYCFPLSYNLHLFKGSISMHLASLTITWKPTNKNIDNFISLLSQVWINKLIWKMMSRFWHISYHMKLQSLQLYIYFGTLLWYSGFYASIAVYCRFPPKVQFLYCLLNSVALWVGPRWRPKRSLFEFKSLDCCNFFNFFYFRVLLRVVTKGLLERHLQPSFMYATQE